MDLDRENDQATVSVPDDLSVCLGIADVKLLQQQEENETVLHHA